MLRPHSQQHRKSGGAGCSRTQLLLLALLFPALLVFIYFIHYTHLHALHSPDSVVDTPGLLTALRGQQQDPSSAVVSKNNKNNNNQGRPKGDKIEQLQNFKGDGYKDNQKKTRKHQNPLSSKKEDESGSKVNSKKQNSNKPIREEGQHTNKRKDEHKGKGSKSGTSRKPSKADDDTPDIDKHKVVPKKTSVFPTSVDSEKGETLLSYADIEEELEQQNKIKVVDGEDGDDDDEEGSGDHASEAGDSSGIDTAYGDFETDSADTDAKSADDEESEAKRAVYYSADDDDADANISSGDVDTSSEVKSKITPPKKVYVPGWKDQAKQKKLRSHSTNQLFNFEPEWGFNGEFKHIQVLPTLKIPLKRDRRVVFPNLTVERPTRNVFDAPTGMVGKGRELLKANAILQTHPLFGKKEWYDGEHSLEEVMHFIQKSPFCQRKPVFLSMATVHDDLYWQLIENFVYTMVKFNTSQCSLVICVSDQNCMKMCGSSYFPCYNYVEAKHPLPSVMEQIAKVKLYYVPKALSMGVDVFMLDLDVGFLGDPNVMIKAFYDTPIVDIMVQEDYIFIMNRTKAGWKQWFTEPLPNIGLFLCRGNNRTAKVFDISWQKYLLMDDPWEKAQPGKDQNHVLDAMRIGRGEFGLKYAYFSNITAPLLDKLVLNYGNVMELGGEIMENFLFQQKALAMHATCYEKSTKVMGLKAANSFWNPQYYDALRKTITKQILFKNEGQLLDEVRSMVWLAMVTERSFILPNILGPESLDTIEKYKGQSMWPGFRVTFLKRSQGKNELKVQLLEPNFYWRVQRDYDAILEPQIIYFDPDKETLSEIKEKIDLAQDYPRIILHHSSSSKRQKFKLEEKQKLEIAIRIWANDSVGLFHQPYSQLVQTYRAIPSVKGIKSLRAPFVSEVLQGMRNCANIFGPHKGNRTCFQVCD